MNLDHITSHYVNRLRLNRAHHFLNQASQRCSCLLGSVVQLEACKQQKEMFVLHVAAGLLFFEMLIFIFRLINKIKL